MLLTAIAFWGKQGSASVEAGGPGGGGGGDGDGRPYRRVQREIRWEGRRKQASKLGGPEGWCRGRITSESREEEDDGDGEEEEEAAAAQASCLGPAVVVRGRQRAEERRGGWGCVRVSFSWWWGGPLAWVVLGRRFWRSPWVGRVATGGASSPGTYRFPTMWHAFFPIAQEPKTSLKKFS